VIEVPSPTAAFPRCSRCGSEEGLLPGVGCVRTSLGRAYWFRHCARCSAALAARLGLTHPVETVTLELGFELPREA
jgi:hypothetical protein